MAEPFLVYYPDDLRIKIRSGTGVKALHLALEIRADGSRDVLGM